MKLLERLGGPLALLIGLLAGGTIGWLAGSWTACVNGPGCEVRIDSIAAIGNWVGGLGTFGALLYGVLKFREETSKRLREALLDSRRSAIRFTAMGKDPSAKYYSKVQIKVTNQTSTDMTNAAFVLDIGTKSEKELGASQQIHSGRSFAVTPQMDALGLPKIPLTSEEIEVQTIVRGHLEDRVSLQFKIHGESFIRTGDEVVTTR